MCVFCYHYLEKIVHNLCTTFSQAKRIQQVFKAAYNARNVPVNQAFYEYNIGVGFWWKSNWWLFSKACDNEKGMKINKMFRCLTVDTSYMNGLILQSNIFVHQTL